MLIEILQMLVLVQGGKPEIPEKNPLSRDDNQQQTQPTYDARGPFLEGPEKFSDPESHNKNLKP